MEKYTNNPSESPIQLPAIVSPNTNLELQCLLVDSGNEFIEQKMCQYAQVLEKIASDGWSISIDVLL